MRKSVSESYKLKKQDFHDSKNQTLRIATAEIKYIFEGFFIKDLPYPLIQKIIKTLGMGRFNYCEKGYVFTSSQSEFFYQDSVENIIAILDIVLQNNKQCHPKWWSYKPIGMAEIRNVTILFLCYLMSII